MMTSEIEKLIFSFVTSFAITFLAIPAIITVARVKHLYDEPNERKLHHSSVPTLGGLGIFAGFLFSMIFWTNFNNCSHLQHLVAAMVLLAFLGIKDDIIGLSPFKKAIGQIFAATIMVIWGDLRIGSMFGIFGVGELPYIISVLFSIFTIFIIINAFNLIDGINGLAATLGIIAATTFGTYFYLTGVYYQQAILAFALTGSLLAFLRFNISPAKIFMGDTGSMLLGIVMSFLAIEFIEVNQSQIPFEFKMKSAPIIAMGVIFIPLYDMIRVFSIRLWHKRSPFKPDQNHLHHLLLKLGYSHTWATSILGILTLFILVISISCRSLGTYWLGFLLLGILLLFTGFLQWRIHKKGVKKMNEE